MAKTRKNIKNPSIFGQLGQGQNPDFNWQKVLDDATGLGTKNPKIDVGQNDVGGSIPPVMQSLVDAPKKPLTMDSDWAEILKNIGQGTDFTQFLSKLGIGGTDPYNQSMHDLNQKIIEQILQHYVTLEQRGYDRALQQDQRLYDTPTNQLARLMGAGISRDAAIQMLNGSGSGSGGAVPYGQIGDDVQMESASQAYANQMSGATAVANSVFGGISALTGLASLGLSIPQAVQQIGIMRNQRYMSNMQRNAFDAASAAHSILLSSGVGITEETFGSVRNTLSTIASLAESGNEAAKAFIQNGGAQQLAQTSPYSSPMLQQMYIAERGAGDYASEFDAHINLMHAQTDVARCNKDNLIKEGKNIEATYNKIVAETGYIEQNAKLCEKTAKYYEELAKTEPARRKQLLADAKRLREEARFLRSHANNLDEQTRGLKMNNDILETGLGLTDKDGKSGMWYASHKVWNQLYGDCSKLAYCNNRQLWLHEVNAIIADEDKRQAVSFLERAYADGTLAALESQGYEVQNLIFLCNAMDECGLFDYVRTEADAGEHSFKIGLSGISWTEKGSLPFLAPSVIKPNKRPQHGGKVRGAGGKW